MLALAKKPVSYVQIPEPKIRMSEFKFTPVDINGFKRVTMSGNVIGNVDSTYSTVPSDIKLVIDLQILPYCVKSQIATIEPYQYVRYNCVVWLKKIGYTAHGIVDFMSRLGWRDFSYDMTSYQVGNIYYNPHCRFSCKRMQQAGLCNTKLCDYIKQR